MSEFIEVLEGIWYEVESGLPWTTRKQIGIPGIRGSVVDPYGAERHRLNNTVRGYLRIRVKDKKILWHIIVWKYFNGEIPDGFVLDHINRDRLDNRIENLRLATRKQNNANCKKRNNTSSKYKGVNWVKKSKKWQAMCCKKYLGYFDNELDAAKAYDEEALKQFGEFAVLNIS